MRHFYVYILASKSRVLYIGVTNDIHRRVWEHKRNEFPGFSSKYRVHRLVYYETFKYVGNAIAREKALKGWLRCRKVALIASSNPTWEDLSEGWYGEIKKLTPEVPGATGGKQVLRFAQDDNLKMGYTTLQLSFDDNVALITLNRPDKRNAVSFALVSELLAALDEIERSQAHVVIITGAGKAFCAGMDLDELKSLLGKTHEENLKDSARMAQLFRRIYEFPLPTIAAVNGAAIAGGTGIATMCDFTLAVPEARFGYTEVRIGFVPAIVSSILVWQVGHKTARDLLLTGRLFDAAEAHRYGLVNEVVVPEQLMTRARALAAQITENSPTSLRVTKKLINGYLEKQLGEQFTVAIEENARIRTTADFREGVSSFLEKRKPRWSGQ